ncbi:vanadium-dependent haloperoxidase [Vallitalea okinawensis]|uniref:vanadium-dependent haloperoxidase n=1 Tax=Vallitalea okinawensis TaxID=2078660 RepID=UPI000CFCACA0|nr:vanadium-dependent haloperoxidase [Vallitalea okinawensis]
MIAKSELKEKKESPSKKVEKKETECLNSTPPKCNPIGPLTPFQRRDEAYEIRENAAQYQRDLPLPNHPCNGDENLYSNKIGNFTKTLPHNELGEVDINAYNVYINALTTGNPDIFETIPLGGSRKLANPQASYAYDLMGPDSHHLTMMIPPTFNSAWRVGEMAEDYWSALTRDIAFTNYDTSCLTIQAAADLSKFSDFRGPKENGVVTTQTLFRGDTPGDLVGPYVSQLFYKDVTFGNKTLLQQYNSPVVGDDFMTSYDEWLSIQNGDEPSSSISFLSTPRYIRNGRDLGQWVHVDFTYQGMLTACLILLGFGPLALDQQNPYLNSRTQGGFVTFGAAFILDFVAKAARVALEAAWYQKFLVQRVLRPEAFGGCVQNNMTGATNYPINQELFDSSVLPKIFSKYGTYLLPMAYPEGSPTHPAYPAGHACVAGACATMLKAFFNEDFVIPDPVVASPDGLSLLPYSGQDLTIGGELNKMASNIAIGRDLAGVHWRSDSSEGLTLGETVAIQILQDYKDTYNEDFNGFTLTKFDGTTIVVG